MKNLILIWSLLLPYLAFGQATNSDTQYRNDGETLINGSFEQGKKGYTFTVGSGSTSWAAQSTTSLNGRAMQLTLSAQTFSFKSATTQGSKLSGQNGYVEVYLSANNSGAEFCPVVDGVSAPTTTPNECQPIIAGIGFKPYGIQKVFGVTSLNYEIRGVSNASYTGVIYADDGSVAKRSAVQSSEIVTEWQDYTMVIDGSSTNPTIGVTTQRKAQWRRVGGELELRWILLQTSGTGGTGVALFKLPNGLLIDSAKINVTTSVTTASVVGYGDFNNSSDKPYDIRIYPYANNSLRAIYLTSSTTFGDITASMVSGILQFSFNARVPIVGWSASNVSFLNQPSNGWLIDVNIGGANPTTTGTPSTYSEITDAGLDMVINSGSALAEIPCSTTNPSSGLTCPVGSESVGVAFIPPKTGKYKVCAYYTANYGTGSSATQLIETPNNAQTILQEGKTRLAYTQSAGSGADYTPHTNCGFFNFSDTNKKTIRLMGEVNSSNITVLGDRNATIGQRDIHFTVEPIVENIQASLQGYNATNGAVNPEFFSAKYGATINTPCTVANTTCAYFNPTGNRISGIAKMATTGQYNITFNETLSMVSCFASVNSSGNGGVVAFNNPAQGPSCTNCNSLLMYTGDPSVFRDTYGAVFCHGVK